MGPADRKQRIVELAEAGMTQRKIAETLSVSAATVNRALRDRAPQPGHSGRPRGSIKGAESINAQPQPQEKRNHSSPQAQPIPVGLELADYLEGEIVDLFDQASRLRHAAASENTVDARVKILKAIADLGERVRALRPPPPKDPNAEPDVIAAAAELVRELERLVALAERERAA